MVFDDPNHAYSSEATLWKCQQGLGTVASYIAHSHHLILDTECNEAAQLFQFRWGLWDEVKDEPA